MEEEYDVIVCGTGLKECILSGLLSVKGKKVLHVDKNPYYGGDCASLNISNLWKHFREGQEPPKELGHNRDWNVDLIPKFVMANGKLVKILLYTKVTRYLEWKCVDGSFVYQWKKAGMLSKERAKICKVPANDSEALKSDLMGLFEKRRCKKFFTFIQRFEEKDLNTYKKFDPKKGTSEEMMKKFKLEPNTIDFIGHAVAMHTNDLYLNEQALPCVEKIQLYMDSIGRYGDSPYLYPIYGLGGIPEGFSRLAAIHGGTYMLRTNADEILFDENGKVSGIQSGDQKAFAKMVICDPTYVMKYEKTKQTAQIIRCICLLDHPIGGTKNSQSCQIILPQRQIGRSNDIYITLVSAPHCVCPNDIYIAMVSTTVETPNPEAELTPGLELLAPIREQFVEVSDMYIPTTDGSQDNLFITKSYDATSHFETATEDVLDLYKRITGEDLDLTNLPDDEEDQ